MEKWTRPAAWILAAMALLLTGWIGAAVDPARGVLMAAEGPAPGDPLEIVSLSLEQEERTARLDIGTDGTLVWTTYRDANDDLVVELPNSAPAAGVTDLFRSEGIVESVVVETEGGQTRLVVSTRVDAEHSVSAEGSRLQLDLYPAGEARASAPSGGEPLEPVPAPEAAQVTAEQPAEQPAQVPVELLVEPPAEEAAAAAVEAWNDPEPVEPEPEIAVDAGASEPEQIEVHSPAGVAATQLHDVTIDSAAGKTTIEVHGDGEFFYSTFRLDDPARFVVDLIGVANLAPTSAYDGSGTPVERVRVAQFKAQPDMVSRVVIDLSEATAPELTVLPDSLLLTFNGIGAPPAPPEPVATEPRAEDEAPAMLDEPVVPEPVQVAALQEEGDEPMMEEEELMVEPMPSPAPPPAPMPTPRPAAPATSSLGGESITLADQPEQAVQGFGSREMGGGDKVYYGEPMTLSLKDADIKDLLRSFAQLSGLNIIIQPGVSGTVTVEFVDVPWDQALEQILKINQLGYEIEGNVMRVAPISVLREEAEEEQRLRSAQAQAVPLTTILKRVSYASARDVERVLRTGSNSVLSDRGTVIVDERTNTLIITELPQFINTVVAVIESLDIPEPQVMIEARIIETTKTFTRTLGIAWGFDAISSAATGNTTGLVFPNNGAVEGAVDLANPGSGTLGITLGNVLNTFNLDIALQAAESEGLINILSAPKITTLNNETASIQSGLQIPIQTVANNTVSVQFVNATLRLQVTPHVTAEGTVLMAIDIQKREPLLGLAPQGSTNAPISTKDARTNVIVRDGGTTVIGGIYEVTTDEGEDKVPGLSRVPILKHLFKNSSQREENEELLIFITPRVVRL
jgi:type IV pilus assembly protein PilQ